VELRGEAQSTAVTLVASVSDPHCITDEYGTGLVCNLITDAIDDIATEFEFYVDDECPSSPDSATTPTKVLNEAENVLSAAEPPIAEEAEEEVMDASTKSMDSQESIARQLDVSMSDSEDSDDNASCDFCSDVCSMPSENPDGVEDIDDMLMATKFAKATVSDDVIMDAYTLEDLRAADFDAMSSDLGEEDEEFLGEGPAFGDELAFDYASDILGGAFMQAAASWKKEEEQEVEVNFCAMSSQAIQDELNLQALKEKAKQALLGATKKIESQSFEIESLKQKARESLLRAAQEKIDSQAQTDSQASETNELKLKVQKALARGVQNGDLSRGFAQVMQKDDDEALKLKVRQALSKGLQNGRLSNAFADAVQKTEETASNKDCNEMEALRRKVKTALCKGVSSGKLSSELGTMFKKDKWEDLRSNVQQTLVMATASGKLEEALKQFTQKAEAEKMEAVATIQPCNDEAALKLKVQQALSKGLQTGKLSSSFNSALQKDQWEGLRSKVQQTLIMATTSGKLEAALIQATQKAESSAATEPCKNETDAIMPRNLHSSRSRRRIIGGVCRSPAMPSATERRRHSKTNRKLGSDKPAPIYVDLGLELGLEEDSAVARESSLTRSYDALGVQMYSLASMDSPSASSAPKLSKVKTRLQDASMSAMAMDLREGLSSASSVRSSAYRSCPETSHVSFKTFTPVPLNLGQKMRPSSSLGSLTSNKMKVAPGGLLPILAPEKTTTESIAWTRTVSKTTSKWSNTGLRGSASCAFF